MSQTMDVNTLLANLAKTYELKARICRQEAAEHQAVIDGYQGELYAPGEQPLIDRALENAARWDARAAEANNGYFLARQVDINDWEFVNEFGQDMTQCQNAGRVVYRASIEEQSIQQGGAGATTPIKTPGYRE